MVKPRIIIADTDLNYVAPIQLKFIEDFFEKVELEIITDRAFFESFFATPQKADILIVSEDLYDPSMSRHNLSHIFLMTEQFEDEGTENLALIRMFKYTSIKEIFNVIISKGGLVAGVAPSTAPQIVLVCSASGGVGKTTVAMGISGALTRNYKRVLYINAGRLQFFQRMLKNGAPIAAADVYSKLSANTGNPYEDIRYVLRKEQFVYLPPFKAALMSLGLEYSVFGRIAVAARKTGEFDFIVIDADSCFDEDMASLIDLADRVITVTTQSAASVLATNLFVSSINGVSEEKFLFVCNDFKKDEDNALISPDLSPRFTVSEYIDHIPHYDMESSEELSKHTGMQKVAFLMI